MSNEISDEEFTRILKEHVGESEEAIKRFAEEIGASASSVKRWIEGERHPRQLTKK